MVGEQRFEPFLIRTEFEVVISFVGTDQWLARDRTLEVSLLRLGFGDVLFLAFVVPTFEFAEVHVAGLEETLHERLDLAFMPGLGGPDEVVIGEVEHPHHLLKFRGIFVGERLGFDALGLSGLLDLDSMLVGSGQEEHVSARESHGPCPDIAEGRGIRVPDVWAVVHVVDRGGDVRGRLVWLLVGMEGCGLAHGTRSVMERKVSAFRVL